MHSAGRVELVKLAGTKRRLGGGSGDSSAAVVPNQDPPTDKNKFSQRQSCLEKYYYCIIAKHLGQYQKQVIRVLPQTGRCAPSPSPYKTSVQRRPLQCPSWQRTGQTSIAGLTGEAPAEVHLLSAAGGGPWPHFRAGRKALSSSPGSSSAKEGWPVEPPNKWCTGGMPLQPGQLLEKGSWFMASGSILASARRSSARRQSSALRLTRGTPSGCWAQYLFSTKIWKGGSLGKLLWCW